MHNSSLPSAEIDNDITDDNSELNLFQLLYYHNTYLLTKVLDTKGDIFSILSLNIQSIHAKFDELNAFLESLSDKNHSFIPMC